MLSVPSPASAPPLRARLAQRLRQWPRETRDTLFLLALVG